MATMVRTAGRPPASLRAAIPTPFPRELLADTHGPDTLMCAVPLLPSINHVQQSCLMALNNLLSEPPPTLRQRRHSMPPTPTVASFDDDPSPAFALQTLLSNLRNDSTDKRIEIAPDDSEASLLRELQMRVDSLSSHDASLEKALVDLLINLHHLSNIQANTYHLPTQPPKSSSPPDAPPPIDVFDTLTRQLRDLRTEHLSSQSCLLTQESSSPDLALQASLLWSRIDTDLETVATLCKQRVDSLPKSPLDLPPQYDDDELEPLPDYDLGGRTFLQDSKSPTKVGHPAPREDEIIRTDLESVTMAIERLYLVAPQLHNQRVELNSSKLAQLKEMERAKAAASKSRILPKTSPEKDLRELERIVEMIGKASSRTLKDQSVILDGSMQSRIHKVKQREFAKKNAFVEQLLQHSDAGRIHDQDAELQVRDPETLLTLPEFIREPLPKSEMIKDGEAMLSLPEFVREPLPPHISSKMKEAEESEQRTSCQRKRSRSLSAPPLAWLKSSASRTLNGQSSLGKTTGQGFDVVYVAENHENLHHILVFFSTTGGVPAADVQAEVMPPFLNLPMDGGDHLLIKSGPRTSLPLMLPAHTNPGKKEVRPQGGHYEIKLVTTRRLRPHESGNNTAPASAVERTSTPLLDAAQLSTLNPVSFVCASCSLPLIQSTKIDSYRDLPSEHWEELVEAWMCHSDQKLNDHVADQGRKGFWPSPGQALVGGSYILFEESGMNAANLHVAVDNKIEDDWHLLRCLCGAVIGRRRDRESHNTKVYRVLKYAVRPVSPHSEPLKIPLSAFVVQDMMEYVQAHASYRFVIRDEEEEKARILIWLFKPRIRIAYTARRHCAIPKSANILAAKVLFKLLGPSELQMDIESILDKYPGFPQAEYLAYPMSACRHIAAMLNDSNSVYPEGLRTMTGLEVGWLQRR